MINKIEKLAVLIALVALVFFVSPVSAEFNMSSNQSGLNWEVYATTPVNLANTTGCFWVNWTWDAGTVRIPPSSWNVSINGTWHNDTVNPFYNQSTVAGHTWINISLWGWNSTDGVLSESFIEGQQQAANSPPVITDASNWQGVAGELVYLDFNYTDLDGDVCTFSTDANKGSFNAATGVFEWKTSIISEGVYYWWFKVSDGYGGEDTYDATITVGDYATQSLIDTTETSYTLLGILGIVFLVSYILIVLFAIQNGEEINYTTILIGFVMLIGFFILLYIMLPLLDAIISATDG